MFPKRAAPVVLPLCLLVFASCSDRDLGLGPELTRSPTLVGAMTGVNPHVYFLTPLGEKNPGGNPGGWNPGTYNVTTLSPSIGIWCVNACVPESSTTFSGADVQVFSTHYQADISGNNVPLTLGGTYLITVSVLTSGGTLVLGQITHVIADNAQRNLSVRVRIEDGALCYSGAERLDECGTGTINPNDGGVIVVPIDEEQNQASLFVLPGFRDVPTTFLFTRLTDLPCLDTDYAQFEGCFSLTLEPPLVDGEKFAEGTVWIGYCLDQRVRSDYVEKYKSPDDKATWDGSQIQALDYYDGDAPHIPHEANLDCDVFEPAPNSTVVARATHRVKRALRGPLAFVFGTPLMATDLVRHVAIRDASRFGWARLLTVSTQSTNALANAPVNLTAVVRYHASQNARDAGFGHHHGDYVSALPVRFKHNGQPLCNATTGAGTTSGPADAANGTATCAHIFAAAGTYSIVPEVDGRDYPAFSVVVTSWQATFLTPLSDSNPNPLPTQLTNGAGAVRVTCVGGGCMFETLDLPYSARDFKGGKYQINWKIAGAAPGDQLTFQVWLGTTPLPPPSSIVVASAPKYNVGSTLPIAWRIERWIIEAP